VFYGFPRHIRLFREVRKMRLLEFFLTASLSAFIASGCASLGQHARKGALSVQDIIYMTKEGVEPRTIKRKINSTGSFYLLNTEQIIRLTKEGVSDEIIESMLVTAVAAEPPDWYSLYYLPYIRAFDYYMTVSREPYPNPPWMCRFMEAPYYIDPYTGVPRSKSVFMGLGNYHRWMRR